MAKDYEGDYQYGEAGQFDKGYRVLPESIKHARIREIATVFQHNVERVVSMHVLPINLIGWAARLALAEHRITFHETADEAWAKGTILLKRLVKIAEPLKARPDIELQEGISGGVESTLCAVLMGSYTAFETAACDLWVDLVNLDSVAFANWVGNTKNKDKNIGLAELAGEGLNLTGRMGAYLHRAKKVSFDSLRNLRDAYEQAFNGEADSCFDPGEELRQAEQIRHLLAHRAGLVDARFKAQFEKFPEFDGIQVGAYLKVTGPMVCKYAYASIRTGVNLFRFADARLRECGPNAGAS